MEQPTWERSKRRQLKQYSRRRPEETVLYRVIYHYRDELERRWDELFHEHYGSLRREVLDALDRYLSCGILAHGCARARCEKCNHSRLIAFSCKRRCLCPSCDTKRALLFAEHLESTVLLPYPHRHVVWSIPKRLRVYFRYDRKLIKHLYTAAWRAWRETMAEALPGGQSAAVMALHTSGDLLNFHPHIHSLCLDGVIDSSGEFQQLAPADLAAVTQALTMRFADNVFDALLRAELISQDTIDNMRSWEHSGFNVFLAEPTPADNRDARLFLARYLKRSPLSLERTTLIESALTPTIRLTKILDDGDLHRDLSPLEFLAELQQHIPDIWEQTTRYLGKYAARTRATERRQNELKQKLQRRNNGFDQQQAAPVEPPPKASSSWVSLIKRVYEVDPLVCDKCGGAMKIIAFLQREREINKLVENLGYPKYRAPPPLHKTNSRNGRIIIEPVWDDFEQSTFN